MKKRTVSVGLPHFRTSWALASEALLLFPFLMAFLAISILPGCGKSPSLPDSGLDSKIAAQQEQMSKDIESLRVENADLKERLAKLEKREDAEQDTRKKVSTSELEIVGEKGQVVASIKGADSGATLQLISYSAPGIKSGTVALGVGNSGGPFMGLRKGDFSAPKDDDSWAFVNASSYTFNRGKGVTLGDSKYSATLDVEWDSITQTLYGADHKLSLVDRISGVSVAQELNANAKGDVILGVNDGLKSSDGKPFAPASMSILNFKGDGSPNDSGVGVSIGSGLLGQSDPWARFNSSDKANTGLLTTSELTFYNEANLGVVDLSLKDGAGILRLFQKDGKGTYVAGIGNSASSQQEAFEKAVAYESQTQSIPDRINVYMRVVAMDPDSSYGKAASTRIAQMDAMLRSILAH